MKVPFAFRLAAREARSTVRRLGAYTVAIAAGIAALVAINSFRSELVRSVADESRGLLGADLRISSGRPLPDSVQAVVDSATAAGVPVATVTGTVSVALAPSGLTRLVQVRGVEGAYPFYGTIVTEPAGLWGTFAGTHDALVDPSLLLALEARVGDSLRIGQASFRIAGTLAKGPVELGPQSLIAPRVWISRAGLADAGLIQFGSLVTYRTFLRIPDADALQRFGDRYHDFFRRQQVRQTTAEEQSREIGEGFEWMTRFLGLIGLTALLLGGLGVASAVNVFVKQKRATIATLRCLGATPRTAFLAYLLQAALLGLIGSIAGIMVGLVVQAFLPAVFGPMIPVDVHFRVNPLQLLGGLAIGVWVATVFALLPLLEVRTVSPLQALRHDVQPEASPRDPVRWAVAGRAHRQRRAARRHAGAHGPHRLRLHRRAARRTRRPARRRGTAHESDPALVPAPRHVRAAAGRRQPVPARQPDGRRHRRARLRRLPHRGQLDRADEPARDDPSEDRR